MQYTCKRAHTPWYSSLIIFCKTLCYPIRILQCVIKNDSFERKTCCTLVSKKAKPHPQDIANPNSYNASVNKST